MIIITSDELKAACVAAGVFPDRIRIFALEFALPTPQWITDELGPATSRFYEWHAIVPADNRWDCVNFSLLATTAASICWAKGSAMPASLAFGMFGYIDGVEEHSVNVAVHKNGAGLYLAFYEPQEVCAPIRLDHDAVQSCLDCCFY